MREKAPILHRDHLACISRCEKKSLSSGLRRRALRCSHGSHVDDGLALLAQRRAVQARHHLDVVLAHEVELVPAPFRVRCPRAGGYR